MKPIIFFTALLCLCRGLCAQPLMLVTEDEYLASSKNPVNFSPKLVPVKDAPMIELVSPNLTGPINSPTMIEIKFIPKAPATIKTESFKAYYGTFQIDITGRLVGVAKVEPKGINVKEATLPKGEHKLMLNVEDSEGRIGIKTIAFEIK